jgi:selenocysteine-specific elongation factor
VLETLDNGAINQRQLRQSLGVREALLKLILRKLIANRQIEASGNEINLPGKNNSLAGPAATLWKKVEPILLDSDLQPPVLHELAKQVSLPAPAVEKLLESCVKQGLLVRPVKNRFFLPATLDKIRDMAIALANAHGGRFTVIQFRDHSGIGRNLCIELLEHLDGKGFTKRLGDQRLIQDINR